MEQISDRQLFEELDLNGAGLEAVRTACDAGETAAAKSALLEHFKSRARPLPPPLDEGQDNRGHGSQGPPDIVAEADRIVDHVFTFVGHPPQQLDRVLRWNEDPVDYDQWAISFNRHFHWVTLARAWKQTGDEKYADEFVAQLLSWVDAMPVEIGKPYIQFGPATKTRNSLSLDAGIRMGQTWVHAFYAFLDAPGFTPDVCATMVKAFRDHAVYLMDPAHFRSRSNWGVMESNGLYHIGAYFPEFKAAGLWLETAMRRLHGELDLQIYPDGAQIELTSGYHHVSLRNFVGAYRTALRNDLPVPDDYVASLERAYNYSLYVAFPDLLMPAVNDSGSHDIRSSMRDAHDFFPDRADFEWVATDRASGQEPPPDSSAFPWAGYFLMRSAWDPDSAAMFFDGGPYGYAHQHEDKLNLILYAHGRILIADPGNYQYDPSEWRKYMLSTWSHNTVTVDGQPQRRGGRPREDYVLDEPLPHTWVTDPEFDFVSAEYAEGYGPDRDATITHRRSIFYLKPDLWIVADFLTPTDDAEHTYESAFHLTSDAAMVDGLCASSESPRNPGCVIHGLTAASADLRIAMGDREPRLRGWMPKGGDISRCHPTPTPIYTFAGSGKVAMAYVITPVAAGAESPVTTVRRLATTPTDISAVAGSATTSDGRTLYFVIREPGDHRLHIMDGDTDAEAGVMITDRSGTIRSLHLANGTGVRGEGQRLAPGDTIY